MKVYFIGAGPGDKGLITIKGYNALKEAQVVVYAGSLVNPELLDYCSEETVTHNSAGMNLTEIIEVMATAVGKGQVVARLHTGDPSLFGAIREQMEELDARDIPYEIIPGVSSFLGASASLKVQYTVPEIAQSLIITRIEGRTPVPEGERLEDLARHRTSMCIFLSVQKIDEVVSKLREGGYPGTTPAAVVFKATWPDEEVVRGTLEDIGEKVKAQAITKTALILVGEFLGKDYNYSKLYDEGFSHEFRK